MSLITVASLSKSFGALDLFSGLSFAIPRRARIGLVGANGVGKTTLLRILLGMDEPSGGSVQRARGLRMGYLPQEARLTSQRALWQECLSVFGELLERQAELARLEAAMADAQQAEAALETYGKLQVEFENLGGYTFELRAAQVLTGLGFQRGDFDRPVEQLSGGQRTRALLAKLLLENPDLLLLDEPTNHLDMDAVEWLETYLREWAGAVLIVSHDRYFLDQVAETIWEMTPPSGGVTPALEIYSGNYSAYLAQREERYARQLEEFQAQQEFIEKEMDYIRRNIAGQNTRQAQGRRKRLERMLEEARLAPPKKARRLHFNIQAAGRSGDLVLRSSRLAVGYHDEGKPLFHAPDLLLRRGECAAVIGPNGAGKTTFLKTLLGQIPPYSGEVLLGASLKIGYFAQAHEGLNPELTLMESIFEIVPDWLPAQARDYLARFLFTGDDVFKTVNLLSGGERGRLALARLALQGANLLLLDEPTNHLDLPAQETLQSLLADYQGTILLISHDRYLIDSLATQIWEVLPGRQALRLFEGSYSEYRAALAAQAAAEAARRASAGSARRASAGSARRSEAEVNARASFERPRGEPSNNRLRQRQQQLEAVEAEIHALETRLAALSRRLENPPADPQQVRRLGEEFQQVQAALETQLNRWAELHEQPV
ncbi:MAG: ABC-F family ATP-binding cassette domain-containing protein [Bellilinea sp.]|jgi:ATP-binding cassette subfamily F protein 3